MPYCPFCAEKIQSAATVCKHCKRDLGHYLKEKEKHRNENILIFILIVIGFLLFSVSILLASLFLIVLVWGRNSYLKKTKIKNILTNIKDYKISIFITIILSFIAMAESVFVGCLILLGITWLYTDKERLPILIRLQNFTKYKFRIFLSAFIIILSGSLILTQNYKEKTIEVKKNYPSPEITVLSKIVHQGSNTEYRLRFSVENAEEIFLNGAGFQDIEGVISKKVPLLQPKTHVSILAKNKYRESRKELLIEREETDSEKLVIEKLILEKQYQIKEQQEKENNEFKKQLKREIDSFNEKMDISENHDTMIGLQVELALFSTWANLINKAQSYENKEIQNLGTKLKQKVQNFQAREFPAMRRSYGKLSKGILWEHNIDVRVYGSSSSVLELTGGIFANNGNIKEIQSTIGEMLKFLRFDRVNYKWYKYDDEYTYYDLKSLNDQTIIEIK